MRALPVKGANAESSCNIACYATPECRAYVLSVDAKGRMKCYLKKCTKVRAACAS